MTTRSEPQTQQSLPTPTAASTKLVLSPRKTRRILDPSAIPAAIQFAPLVDRSNPGSNNPQQQEQQSSSTSSSQTRTEYPSAHDLEPTPATEFDSSRLAQPFLDGEEALAKLRTARGKMKDQILEHRADRGRS